MSAEAAQAENALQQARDMLGADGYDLRVESDVDLLRIRIVATSDACEECLVPRTVMEPMLAKMLADGGIDAPMELEYPTAHHQA